MAYNASGSVHMYNDGAYIRVTNDNNGVVIHYVKASLIIQKDSASSFFLKNDSIINYYNYTDVATPISNSIDDLISQIKSWNTSMSSNLSVTSVTTFSDSIMDSFDRLKTSYPQDILLSLNNTFSSNGLRIDELTSNAMSTFNGSRGAVSMNVLNSAGSRIVRQSKLYPYHVYGSTSTAIVNGTLTTNNTNSNIVSRIGVFDDSNDVSGGPPTGNGVFFQYDNKSNLRLVHRTSVGGSQVDTVVPRANWNLDTLDGNGASGITLNVTEPINFLFEWNQANSSAIAKAGVYRNGATYCHAFSNAPLFGNASLPVRWEMFHDSNLGSANSATMIQGNAVVLSDSGFKGNKNVFAYDLGSNFKMLNASSNAALFSIRLSDTYERAQVHVDKLEIINIASGGVGKWQLILNPSSLTGQVSFSNVASTSFVEADMSGLQADGGICVATGYIYDAGVTQVPLSSKDISLLCSITGQQDTLTLSATNINGTLNLSASVEWSEIQ